MQPAIHDHRVDGADHDEGFDVGGIIRRIRRVEDLSQRELAARLGVAPSTVAKWECGRQPIRVDQMERVMALAGVQFALVDEKSGARLTGWAGEPGPARPARR